MHYSNVGELRASLEYLEDGVPVGHVSESGFRTGVVANYDGNTEGSLVFQRPLPYEVRWHPKPVDAEPLNEWPSTNLSAEYARLMARARDVHSELDRRRRKAEADLLARGFAS
jgi:hypothetical protein